MKNDIKVEIFFTDYEKFINEGIEINTSIDDYSKEEIKVIGCKLNDRGLRSIGYKPIEEFNKKENNI